MTAEEIARVVRERDLLLTMRGNPCSACGGAGFTLCCDYDHSGSPIGEQPGGPFGDYHATGSEYVAQLLRELRQVTSERNALSQGVP